VICPFSKEIQTQKNSISFYPCLLLHPIPSPLLSIFLLPLSSPFSRFFRLYIERLVSTLRSAFCVAPHSQQSRPPLTLSLARSLPPQVSSSTPPAASSTQTHAPSRVPHSSAHHGTRLRPNNTLHEHQQRYSRSVPICKHQLSAEHTRTFWYTGVRFVPQSSIQTPPRAAARPRALSCFVESPIVTSRLPSSSP
jgi:hypothetical protein